MKKDFIKEISGSLQASYSQFASEFDQTRQRQWPEFDHFLAYTRKGSTVLDLGCGNGRLYEFLKSKELNYLGVDHNSHLLDLARKNFPEGKFQLDDMMDLNLEEGAFDNIFCVAAFHHVPTKKMRRKVLGDIHKALKDDGVLILTTWNLIQIKYLKQILKSVLRCILTLGFKGAWNDLFIKWGDYPIKRYYHAFLPAELMDLFEEDELGDLGL